MRLINTTSRQLEAFVVTPPPYAILSHRWGYEEVTFQDLQGGRAEGLKGFSKLQNSIRHAREHGFEYLWLDTCCIDKTSSLEHSEAINSMFHWYRNAAKCFVFMSDVDSLDNFATSEWFTRGWTLQELIAPKTVDFLGREWNFLGDRVSLKDTIVEITKVSESVLMGANIASIPACQKMAWVAGRKTSKAEDMAYCMMGLFGVNMALLYGEGEERAFLRLQEHFIRESDDESIFAWSTDAEEAATKPFWSLLATSPKYFAKAHNYTIPRFKAYRPGRPPGFTNRGLELSLPLQQLAKGDVALFYIAVINCCHRSEAADDINSSFSVTLQQISNTEPQYARIRPDVILPAHPDESAGEPGPLVEFTSGLRRKELQTTRMFVRSLPEISSSIAGFSFNSTQRMDFLWSQTTQQWIDRSDYSKGSRTEQFSRKSYVEAKLADYVKDKTPEFGLLQLSDAEVKHGEGAFDPARLRSRQVVGRFSLRLRAEQYPVKWNQYDSSGAFHLSSSVVSYDLIVGLEPLPKNPMGTPAGYVRPWYCWIKEPADNDETDLVTGEKPLKSTVFWSDDCRIAVEFEPASYMSRTYLDVKLVRVPDTKP